MNRVFICSVLLVLVCPALLRADTNWINQEHDCQSFLKAVTEFSEELGDPRSLSIEQRSELKQVVEMACSERFNRCDFSICQPANDTETEPTSAGAKEEKESAIASTNPEIVDKSDTPEPVVIPPAEKKRTSALLASSQGVTLDPFAWLDSPLSCEEVLDQFRARYAPLGDYTALPDEKRNEIHGVLSVICNRRFSHCKFSSCETAEKFGFFEEKKPVLPSEHAKQQQETEYQKQLSQYNADQQQRILEARTREQAKQLGWTKFTVPGDSSESSIGQKSRTESSQKEKENRSDSTSRSTRNRTSTRSTKAPNNLDSQSGER